MAGPAGHKPAGRLGPIFGTATQADLQPFLGVMQILHQEPIATAFNHLLLQQQRPEDEVALAHVFEEVSTLAHADYLTGARVIARCHLPTCCYSPELTIGTPCSDDRFIRVPAHEIALPCRRPYQQPT